MSFSAIAARIDDSDVEAFGGKEKATSLLERLDLSWGSVSRTTVGVMLAVEACSPDPALSHKCLSGLLGMMSKMSDVYCSLLGWGSGPVEQEDLLRMSNETDAAGQELGRRINKLGGAVMVGLLQSLPSQWTGHFRMLVEARAGLSRLLSGRALPYLSNLLAEEQVARTKGLLAMADRTVFSPNSKPAERAREWAKAASGVYEAVLAGGFRMDVALAEAVRKVGFPKP
jgi:hypothetical protein